MITGVFYDETVKRNKAGKQIKKIVILIVEANLLFLIWKLLLSVHSGNSVIGFLQDTIAVRAILKFIVLNESPFNGHLWYLGAILYVLIIFAVADKMHLRKLLYIITPILLIGDLVLGKYSLVLLEQEFPYIIVRNFLFVGIPYFSIGCLLKRYESNLKESMRNNVLTVMTLLFTLTTLLERYILVSAGLNPARDHYISSTFLAVTVFMIAVKKIGIFGKNGKVANVLKRIGQNYSAWIYIVHPIFIMILGTVMKKFGAYNIYQYGTPIVVYILS